METLALHFGAKNRGNLVRNLKFAVLNIQRVCRQRKKPFLPQDNLQ